uniref:Brl1/Brr6 domain-containing protein n=1 Tax=Spongospora subterranea TaxID=70186 RepID=A0A0H5QLM2_9EUKA|eukprot:CRZ02502.1 hypothetical protein [Spongospora subterranea]
MAFIDDMEVEGITCTDDQTTSITGDENQSLDNDIPSEPDILTDDHDYDHDDRSVQYVQEYRNKWDEMSFRRHLLLPHIISGYLQLSFNLVMISFIMYALASFVSSVHGDIDSKVSEYSGAILNEIAECHNNHRANLCGTPAEVPVLRPTCAMWERCMARDPTTVARTKLSAHTIGEILNNFVEPLSYKAMGFFTFFLFCFIIASNIAFKLGASKPVIASASSLVPEWNADDSRRQAPLTIRQRRPSSGYRKMIQSADVTRY